MKKLIHTLFLTITGLTVTAQISLPDSYHPDTTRSEFHVSAMYDAQSTSLRRDFTNQLLRGGELSRDELDGVFSKQKNLNRLGREYHLELRYVPNRLKVPGLTNFRWVIEASHQSFLSLSYTDDFFGLAFYGNARYAGDSLDLTGLDFRLMSWQTLGAGLQHKPSKSWFSVNFVHQNVAYQGQIDEGYFYTSADSSQINAKLEGQFDATYQSKFSQGYGVALNAELNFAVERNKNENLIFQVSVRNMGVARSYQVLRYEADTSIQFSGFTFSELMNWNSASYENKNWLDTLGLKTDTLRSVWMVMPARLQVAKIINPALKQNVQAFYGVKAYPFIRMIPKVYAGADFRLKQNWHLGVSASYGGFGGFRAGIYANYTSNRLYAGIGTEEIAGAISRLAFGQMINFRLVCAL